MSLTALYDALEAAPVFSLAHLPTPIERLDSIEAVMAEEGTPCPALYIKRDDATGLAFGGNKTRKLEYLVGAALEAEATRLVTTGAVQSNHCRQTAAAARVAGMAATLLLIDRVEARDPAYHASGNVLLDRWLGADLRMLTPDLASPTTVEEILAELRDKGEVPFYFPAGGSDAIGTRGYVEAYFEIQAQCEEMDLAPDCLVHASSSGGTQAGLSLASAYDDGHGPYALGINVYRPDTDAMAADISRLAAQTADALSLEPREVPVTLEAGHLGEGYGQPTDAANEAIQLMAQGQGILLDPVYSGKAMAGLLAMIRQGRFAPDDTVIFIHTGGAPALFAYPELLG